MRRNVAKLTRGQRKMLEADLAAEDRKTETVAQIESRAADHPGCPHCSCERVVKNGTAHGLQRYKCRGCSKTFNALTGTPLTGLHLRGKWAEQVACLRDGATLTEVQERLGVARTTAHRWRHRFLAAPKALQAQMLSGIAEMDETYILRSRKGQRAGLGQAPRKRGGKASTPGLSVDQVPVLVARDRSGATADFILAVDNSANIVAVVDPILAKDAVLCTESNSVMMAAARKLGVEHHPVNVSAGIRVDGAWHVQNVNSYHARFKNWLRHFKGVATKYLDSYLGWFRAIERSPGHRLDTPSFLALAASR